MPSRSWRRPAQEYCPLNQPRASSCFNLWHVIFHRFVLYIEKSAAKNIFLRFKHRNLAIKTVVLIKKCISSLLCYLFMIFREEVSMCQSLAPPTCAHFHLICIIRSTILPDLPNQKAASMAAGFCLDISSVVEIAVISFIRSVIACKMLTTKMHTRHTPYTTLVSYS